MHNLQLVIMSKNYYSYSPSMNISGNAKCINYTSNLMLNVFQTVFWEDFTHQR